MATTGAGHLFYRVAWDMRREAEDGHGNSELDFIEQFQTRAGFTYLRGGETVMASRLEGRQPIVVRVRASGDTRRIEPDWRMRNVREGQWLEDPDGLKYWEGPIFAVRSIAPTDDRLYLDIMVESGVAP